MRLYLLLVFFFLQLGAYCINQSALKEEIFIHTSADTLYQGETLWFQGYLKSSFDFESSDKVLYVDIVAVKSNAIIMRKVFYMKNGTATGDFYFGNDLPNGKYLLRGYTQWIANYASHSAFEKVICIQSVHSDLTDSIIDEEATLPKPTSFMIDFYPEGTTWLAHQQTQFAVKIGAPLGKSAAQSATIFNKTGKSIGEFSTDSLGFGFFILSSADEGNYAVLKQDVQKKKYFLPRFSDTGVTMNMNFSQDSLKILVFQTGKDTLNKKPFLLVGKKAGEFFRRDAVPLGQELTVIKIPNRFLPDGILNFELYQGAKLIAERVVLPTTLKEYQISMQEENRSDSIFVAIKSSPYAQLSLSATFGGVHGFPDRIGYIVSELKNPSLLQRYANAKHPYIDQLLLTLSAKDLKESPSNKNSFVDYSPEKGMRISGRVIERKKPLVGANISLSLKSASKSLLLASQTDSSGRFFFDNLVYYGKSELKLVAMNAAGEKVGTILLDTTFTTLEIPVLPSDTLSKYSLAKLISRDSINAETEAKIKGYLLNEVVVKTDRLNFLLDGSFIASHKDQVFNLTKEDLEYQTLTSWMLNHVKGATNPYGEEVSGEENGIVFRGNDAVKLNGYENLYVSKNKAIYPQFVVNGREYIYDYDNKDLAKIYHQQFFDLSLDKIKSVRIRRLTGFYNGIGILVDQYIIYLTIDDTYKEKGVLIGRVNGFDESASYIENETFPISTRSSSLLFWEPNIITDQNGEATVKFKHPRNIGGITYQIEGKALNGKLLSLQTNLEP
ncbi:MAG TPA: hypothetical protein VL125_11570 [Pelobium sp.]|nr:hypothetical protein [Pelobium sp.]